MGGKNAPEHNEWPPIPVVAVEQRAEGRTNGTLGIFPPEMRVAE